MEMSLYKAETAAAASAESTTSGHRNELGYNDENNPLSPPQPQVSSSSSSSRSCDPCRTIVRGIIILTAASILILVIIDLSTAQHIQAWLRGFLVWMERHPYSGIGVFIAVYAICTILFVPGAILTIGCGYTFGHVFDSTSKGVLVASIAVFIGASIGSIMAFLLGRYLFRDCVVSMAQSYPVFKAVDRALEHNGVKIMILLRLSPLIPYNALDYISGVTAIPFWPYAIALVGILPGVIMFTFIGATASDLAEAGEDDDKNDWIHTISLIFGILFACLGVFVATYYANKELKKILEEQSEDEATCSFVPHEERTLPTIT